jgi:hypothetical protein
MAGDIEVIWVRRQVKILKNRNIFLPKGLDRANQLDPAQQIRFYAQILGGLECSPSRQINRAGRRTHSLSNSASSQRNGFAVTLG